MSDKDRKEDAETKGEDESDEEAASEEEGSKDDESETEGGDDADEAEASGDEGSDEEGSDEEGSDDEASDDDASAEEEEAPKPKARAKASAPVTSAKKAATDDGEAADEGDEVSASRVAKALGIEDDEEEGGGDAAAEVKEEEVVVNRAARRREEAMERRRKRRGKAAAASPDEEELPKDKNARAKELLKRRREQSTVEKQPINLLPAEMVDDALSRSASATGKWIRANFNVLQWVILLGAVGVGGYLLYTSQLEKAAAAATASLTTGLNAERGVVMAEDKRTDEEKEGDPTKVFKTEEERTEAALAGYRKTMAEHAGKPAALLAKLGEAGVLLAKRDWDGAIAAYGAVLSSKLAATDVDVKGHAIEGLGLAKEGKGDLDGAIASFKELEAVDARGFKELGMYQQGRILLAKGEKEKAKDLLKMVREKLQTPSSDGHQPRAIEDVVDETLRSIDPSLVPTKAPVMGGPKGEAMSAEQMDKIRKLLEDAAKKKGADH